jgi:hypothetical protein
MNMQDGLGRQALACLAAFHISTALEIGLKRFDMNRGQVAQQDGEVNGPKTLTVPEAGRRYFDLGRNASYAARLECAIARSAQAAPKLIEVRRDGGISLL